MLILQRKIISTLWFLLSIDRLLYTQSHDMRLMARHLFQRHIPCTWEIKIIFGFFMVTGTREKNWKQYVQPNDITEQQKKIYARSPNCIIFHKESPNHLIQHLFMSQKFNATHSMKYCMLCFKCPSFFASSSGTQKYVENMKTQLTLGI